MVLLPELDEKTYKPTGNVFTREQAHKKPGPLHPVGISIIIDRDSGEILIPTRSESRTVLRGKKYIGVGEHATLVFREDENYDLKFFYPEYLKDKIPLIEGKPGFKYESNFMAAARGIREELRPQKDGKTVSLEEILEDSIELDINVPVNLTPLSNKNDEVNEYHGFSTFLYDKEKHGEFNPKNDEIKNLEWVPIKWRKKSKFGETIDEIFENLPEEYCTKAIKAIREAEKKNINRTYFQKLIGAINYEFYTTPKHRCLKITGKAASL